MIEDIIGAIFNTTKSWLYFINETKASLQKKKKKKKTKQPDYKKKKIQNKKIVSYS